MIYPKVFLNDHEKLKIRVSEEPKGLHFDIIPLFSFIKISLPGLE